MAKVAIDVDDTLYPFWDKLREEFFIMSIEYDDSDILRGAYATTSEWRSLTDSVPLDIAVEAIHRVHEKALHQTPYEHAVDVVNQLIESGHEIVYVTSRDEKYHNDTYSWLYHQGFPIESGAEANLICMSGSKIPHIRDCKYLIDDRPQTVVDFISDYVWKRWYGSEIKEEDKRIAFGLWFPYNQALTDINNVYLAPSWLGIEYYLRKKGIIV
jgi:uncharacterized HAD superfamily protein